MSKLLSDESHPSWGQQYPKYTASYTNDALATSLLPASDSHLKAALGVVDEICKLSRSSAGASTDHITLFMLRDILDITNDPGALHSMADPNLVCGCVSLMASVGPSALEYEYGYVSFRILVIALNACLLKQAGCLDETVTRMKSVAASQRSSTFWDASSWLIHQSSQGNKMFGPAKLFNEKVLDQLLKLLYQDEKLFLLVSKATGSLGLSGVMFVLYTHLLATEKRYKSREDHFAEITRPYIRIFYRYFIVTPDFESEEIAMFDLHTRVTPHAILYYEKPVDAEDSRNLVQAVNNRMESSRPVSALLVAAMLRFVAPMVVSGCEDLIPTTVKLCTAILWKSMSIKADAAYARQTVLNFLLYLRDMLMALKPVRFADQPWIWEVVDQVVKGDLLDLALRVFATVSKFDGKDFAGTEGQLFTAPMEVYIALAELAPVPDLAFRFFEAGSFSAWSKCYFYFRVNGTGSTYQDTFTSDYSVNWACGEIIAGVMSVLIGSGWEEFVSQASGSCDNPRCPMTCYAMFTCSQCVDMVYCSTNCATQDWVYALGGPHNRVCRQQAKQDPLSRQPHHRNINILPGFNQRLPSVTENSLSARLIKHIQGKWTKPKSTTMQGVMVKGDYSKPEEFNLYKSASL